MTKPAAPAPLDPEGYVKVPGFGKWLPRGLKYLFEQIGVPEGGCAVMEAVDAVLENRRSVPLDPGNPEHLRQVAEFLAKAISHTVTVDLGDAREAVRDHLVTRADYMDRERAEKEQDAEDRKRAEEIAREHLSHGVLTATVPMTRDNIFEAVLAGIRAGRAERQEVGQ